MTEYDDSALFELVDAAIKRMPPAPATFPDNPQEVRERAGYTAEEFADMVGVTATTIRNWESGRRSQGEKWRVYCFLLDRLENRGNPERIAHSVPPVTHAGPPARLTTVPPQPMQPPPYPAAASARPTPSTAPRQDDPTPPTVHQMTTLGRRIGSVGVMSAADGGLVLHLPDGRTTTCPATTLEHLPDWAARTGLAPWYPPANNRTHQPNQQLPPLLALTASATAQLGLPPTYQGPHQQRAEQLLARAGRQPADGPVTAWPHLRQRQGPGPGLQLVILPWTPPGSLTELATPTDTARLLDRYTSLLLPPAGPPADCGTRLMSLLRPALDTTAHHDPGPHHTQDTPWAWWRTPQRSERERHPVVFALRMALPFANAVSDAHLPSAPPEHQYVSEFDKTKPGRWLVDLTDYPFEPHLPVPFTPDGQPPTGPGWYPTAAVDYAIRRGCRPQFSEAWLCPQRDRHLQPWYEQLREAQLDVMKSLGVDVSLNPDPEPMLTSLERLHQHPDTVSLALLHMIAATEAAAILTPTGDEAGWMPYARDALLAAAAANQHRKLALTADARALSPLAATPHWILYSAPSPDVFHVIARTPGGKPSPLHLGLRPGSVQPLGRTTMENYTDLVAGLSPGDPAAPALLRALIPSTHISWLGVAP